MPILRTPEHVRPGGRLRDKESGEEFRITHVGYMVQFEGESSTGEVRSDMLNELFDALPPEVDDTPSFDGVLADEETALFETLAYQMHYKESMSPLSAAEYLQRTADGAYATPGLDDMRKFWDAGRTAPKPPEASEVERSQAWTIARLTKQLQEMLLHAGRLHKTAEEHAIKNAPDLNSAMEAMTDIKLELAMTPQYAVRSLPDDCVHMVVMHPASELDLFINRSLITLGTTRRGMGFEPIQARIKLDALKSLSPEEFRVRAQNEFNQLESTDAEQKERAAPKG